MKRKTLVSYKKQFENTSKEKIIEMNYELSKKLCDVQEKVDKFYEDCEYSPRDFLDDILDIFKE